MKSTIGRHSDVEQLLTALQKGVRKRSQAGDRRLLQLYALKKLHGWEEARSAKCVKSARAAGIIFIQQENGIWRAEFGTR